MKAISDFGDVTRYAYDGISRLLRSQIVLTVSGEGEIVVGASLEAIEDDLAIAESFPPTPDPSHGGGDGIIRSGRTCDANSLSMPGFSSSS